MNPRPMTNEESAFVKDLNGRIWAAGVYDMLEAHCEEQINPTLDFVAFEVIYESEKPRKYRKVTPAEHLRLMNYDDFIDENAEFIRKEIRDGSELIDFVRRIAGNLWRHAQHREHPGSLRLAASPDVVAIVRGDLLASYAPNPENPYGAIETLRVEG